MIVGSPTLGSADYMKLSELHLANLERSIVSQLGLPLLGRYYRYIADSPEDFLFVQGEPGAVRGVAVLSLNSETVMQRFVKSNLFGFLIAVLLTTLRQPSFALTLFKSAGSTDPATRQVEHQPEIVQLFVDLEYRNQRIGRRILEMVDRYLAERNIPRYMIRTRVQDNEATLGFYDRNRFSEFLRADWKGAEFVFMTRTTVPENETVSEGETP